MTTLTLQVQPEAPLEAGSITPDTFEGKTPLEIAKLPAMHGNQNVSLGDFFKIEGNGEKDIILNGQLSRVKNIGAGMTTGCITVHGDVGMHLAAGMRGGQIQVFGNTGDWTGAEMTGGEIHIHGDAGHCLGGAYRGSRHGMNRGVILVEGNAGNEVGAAMRRGLIAVLKNVGDFAGAFMAAGSIVVFGSLGIRAGAGLLRGSIIAFDKPELLPTYRYACSYHPSFLGLIFQSLRNHGFAVPLHATTGLFHRYSGDFNRIGKGEILVHDQC
jgi:formylmethanofuran dehydrogenase subunit C